MGLIYDMEGIEGRQAARAAEKAVSRIVKLNVTLDRVLGSSVPNPNPGSAPATATAAATSTRRSPTIAHDESDPDSESNGSDIPFEGTDTVTGTNPSRPPFLPFWPPNLPFPRRGQMVNGLAATGTGADADFVQIAHGNYVYMHQFDLVVEIVPQEDDLSEVELVQHEVLDQSLQYPELLLFNNMHGTRVGDGDVYGWFVKGGEVCQGVGIAVAVYEDVLVPWVVGVRDLDGDEDEDEESEDRHVMVNATTQVPDSEGDSRNVLRRRRPAISDAVMRMRDRAVSADQNEDDGHSEGEQLDDKELDAEWENKETQDERMSVADSLLDSSSQVGRDRATRATQTVPGILRNSGLGFVFADAAVEMMTREPGNHIERLMVTIAQERLSMRGVGGFR